MGESTAEKLRAAVDAIARDPDLVVEELEIGPPAAPELVARGHAELPADLVDFLAQNDGFCFHWQSRRDSNENGGLHVPSLAEALEPVPDEFGEPMRYVLIDDLEDGHACYYRIDLRQPLSAATIVYAEVQFISGTLGEVCQSFSEYLELAHRYRFHWLWPGTHVVRRWGGGS